MIYEEPAPSSLDELESLLAAGAFAGAAGSLISLALSGDDSVRVETRAIELLGHDNDDLAAAAATSLGHLARLHGSLTNERLARQRLADAAARPSIRGRVLDALDDVTMFAQS